jgi:Fe-S oxidoreductase
MTGQLSTSFAPASLQILGLPAPAIHSVLLLVALATFCFILWKRAGVLRKANPDPRTDRVSERLRKLLVIGFGQSRQPRYLLAGVLHILIFFGFLILSLRSLTLLGEGFVAEFHLPGLGGGAGEWYSALKDYTALIVLACCIVAAIRRSVFKPVRYHDRHARKSHGHEAYLILGLISLLMIADAFYEGSEMVSLEIPLGAALPLASFASTAVRGGSETFLVNLHVTSFWIHNIALLFFLCYLPLSKHFHVISALPNVFLLNINPAGRVKPARYGVTNLDDVEQLGVGKLEDFTWKHILDFYSCTDCGRCTDHCPSYATGTPLSPRMISINCRDLAYESYPVFGKPIASDKRPELVGQVVREEELWACTTCGACEEACPVTIEYIDKIVDMRRFLVDEGRVPTSLQKPLAALEKHGNPYGKMARKRGEWIGKKEEALEVDVLEKGAETDTLIFTDSCAAYDPRIIEISRAFAELMMQAGVECGTLGKDEVDSGHEARRIGEEGLFETLRDQNLDAMEEREFKSVVTCDPHAYNALSNGGYDLDKPVQHHSQRLAELIESGKLKLEPLNDGKRYTFHDPCYLGRHNGEYEAPRQVLNALGVELVEMDRSRNRSFCCGGGSLYLFYEGESESRMGEKRLQMAADAGADVVVTACPFCLINLEDAIKTTGREGKIEVLDLAELVHRSVTGDDSV